MKDNQRLRHGSITAAAAVQTQTAMQQPNMQPFQILQTSQPPQQNDLTNIPVPHYNSARLRCVFEHMDELMACTVNCNSC
jgi:hypothetical protein